MIQKTKNSLRYGGAILLAGLAFVLFARCFGGDTAPKQDNSKALIEIKKEPKIKEAFIDMDILYATVEDDGTDRKGYAEYLCQVLKENKSSVKSVKIFKVNSINEPDADSPYGILLGESYCD